MNQRMQTRLLKDARAELESYAVDMSQYDAGKIELDDLGLIAEVTFSMIGNPKTRVRISCIWYNKKTGAIDNQYGDNYGVLTL
jgi:hypothetical protein